MKKDLFNLIKIITLGIVLSIGAGYLFAWTGNSSPTSNNAATPINITSNSQVKNGPRTPALSSLLDIVGTLSTDALAVTGNAVLSNDLTMNSMRGTGTTNYICAQSDGTIAYCFPLVITKSGGGNGTVTSSTSDINCGGKCSKYYMPGTIITLTATADSGNYFDGWSGACSGSGTTCTITMANYASSVNVIFSPPCYGWKYNHYCWYKETRATNGSGISCDNTCNYHGSICTSNTQTGTEDQSVMSHFGMGFYSGTFGNNQNILAISGGSGYERYGNGMYPETLTSSCGMTRGWWNYICSCIQ
jgi:hypothetical protein